MLGLGVSLTKGVVKALTYVKDNLKLFFNFKSTDRSLHLAGNTSFDGSSDYIDCGNDSSLQITGALSISGWFKTSANSSFMWLVGKDDATNRNFYLQTHNNGQLVFYVTNGGSGTAVGNTTATQVADGEWHHVVAVFNPSTSTKIYIDGAEKASNTSSIPSSIDNDTVNLQLGRRGDNKYYFNGSMANVGIWSRALSQSEIQGIMWKNYADLSTADKSSLSAWWALQADVNDSEGSNNGTNNGATINTSPYGGNSPFVPRIVDVGEDALTSYGKVYSGRALDFDGVSDYVEFTQINHTTDLTICFWVQLHALPTSNHTDMIYGGGGNDYNGVSFKTGGQVKLRLLDASSGWAIDDVAVTSPLTLNKWHHVAVVISDTGDYYKGYLDGKEDVSVTNWTNSLKTDKGFKYMGKGASGYFDGELSNITHFNSALTQSNIEELALNPEMQLPTGVSASNLKGAWMLNEGAGSTVYDGSGEENNGTITGATFVTRENAIAQTALVRANELAVFDGTDDDVHLTSTISLGTGAESISFWVYTTNITNTPSYIIGRHDSVTAFIALRKTATSYVRLGSGAQLTGNDAGFGDGWNHVLITRTDDPLIKFYVNGSERTMSGGADGDGSEQATGGSNQSGRAEGGTTFNSFGSGGSNSNANFGNGIITEIAFFDEDKSSSASTYYNSGTPYDMTNESGLQHYYRNNGSALWQDLKGSNHASAVNGSPSVVLFTEGVTSGKDSAGLAISDETAVSNGVRFYGDGYISTPDSPALQVGSADFTIDAWIKPNLGVGDSLKQIVHMRGISSPNTGVDFHFDDSSNRLRTVFDDGDEALEFLGTTNSITGVWQHVALVVDRTAGEAKHYINGVQSGSTKDISALESSFTTDPSDDLKIGAKLLSGTLYQKYEGLIDEVRLYTKALSADELLKNYNHGKGKHS